MNAVELFAGAGGLGMGVSRSGFKPLAVIEWDKYCCTTIRENAFRGVKPLTDWPFTWCDVRRFDYSKLCEKVDLVSGGPPCQPFSLGGKHGGRLDARDMFPEAIRAVRELRPQAFLFENVKGLTRNTFANYFEYVRLQLSYPEILRRHRETWMAHLSRLEKYHTAGNPSGLYYRVVTRLLDAADYGIPQRRERVFIVGFRGDLGVEWSFPKATHSQDALLWSQWRNGEYWERLEIPKRKRSISSGEADEARAKKLRDKPALKPWRTIREALVGLPDPRTYDASCFLNHRYQPGARVYPGHTGSPLDEPAKTLKAGDHGVPGGENMMVCDDGTVRYFTVRESARLQTFPDDVLFRGSWTEAMRQLGNAVPVDLATVMATNVHSHLTPS
jgi:DNA (cytosine-5)-methyltransferase 1